MKTVLVTGGAGFIGSGLVRRLVARGNVRVVNLDKLTYAGHRDSLADADAAPQHEFVLGDIADRALVRRLLSEHQPDAVVNLAAESHVDRSIDAPSAFLQTNVVGAATLLDESLAYWRSLPDEPRDRFRFLHVSTDEVYGSLPDGVSATTDSPYRPNSPYSASKAAADQFLRAYHETYGLPTIVTHCTNNYGPYQFPEKLIPLMILNAAEGLPLPVYGDGRYARDWLHVDDHCRGIETALEHGIPGRRYHLAAGNEQTNIDIVRAICRLVDEMRPGLAHTPCESLITHVADRPGHDRRYSLDIAETERELDWRAERPFVDGLRDTVCWYLANPAWVAAVSRREVRTQRRGLAERTAQ